MTVDFGRLATLRADDWCDLASDLFEVRYEPDEEPVTTLRLTNVEPTSRPFSLIFEGEANAPLDQNTYYFRHETLGELPIFIVPIASHSTNRRYQAVFN